MTELSNAIEFLRNMAATLRCQDNAYTSSPIYCIQERVLIAGIDISYGGEIGWINYDDGDLAGDREKRVFDRFYRRFGKEPNGWARTGYEWKWRYTGRVYLTRAAAHTYVGNSDKLRVYVNSAYRNNELKEVRRLLSGPVLECIEALSAIKEAIDVEFTSLGFRGIKAVEQARAALINLDMAKEPHA